MDSMYVIFFTTTTKKYEIEYEKVVINSIHDN